MKNIVLQEPGTFKLAKSTLDEQLAPDEALLKVHRIGICGTDLHAYAGEQPFFSYPRILGHELGVEVVDVGKEVKNVEAGERCSVEPYRYTHRNDQAVKIGKPNCAEHLSVLGVHEDGGMREYFKFPAKYLHASAKLSYDQLALVEPLGIGCHAVNRAAITPQDNVIVIGAGPIGLAAIQFAQATGAQVAVMELNEQRLQFCRELMGVEAGIRPQEGQVEDQIRQHFDGELATVILDATGSKKSMEQAFEYVSHGGRLVYIGLFRGDIVFHDPDFHKKELTLLASRNALAADFEQIITAVEAGDIDTSPWITHRINFDDMIAVFDDWLDPEAAVIKAMVEMC